MCLCSELPHETCRDPYVALPVMKVAPFLCTVRHYRRSYPFVHDGCQFHGQRSNNVILNQVSCSTKSPVPVAMYPTPTFGKDTPFQAKQNNDAMSCVSFNRSSMASERCGELSELISGAGLLLPRLSMAWCERCLSVG